MRMLNNLPQADLRTTAASAVALGHVANTTAQDALTSSLANTTEPLRAAIAEGCILCAERRMAEGDSDSAAKVYEQVRKAQLPKQKILEATRGEGGH